MPGPGINWDWLNRHPVVRETEFIRHVRPHVGSSARRRAYRQRSNPAQTRDNASSQTMKPGRYQFGSMLHALQERAKELNCLYQVGELLSRSGPAAGRYLSRHYRSLPPGWQYPHDCQARILFEGLIIQPPDFQVAAWVQKASIVVQGATLERSRFPTGERCQSRTKARS